MLRDYYHFDQYGNCLGYFDTMGQPTHTIVRSKGVEVSRLRRWGFILALLLGGTCSVPASAQSPQAIAELTMIGDGPVLVVPLLMEFADLTTAQTDQARQIVAAGRPHLQHLLSQLVDANNELAEALLAPPAMPGRDADAIVKRLAQLRLELMQEELTMVRAIRKMLTPVQFAKVTSAMEEMKKPETHEPAPAEGTF
jgi:Spy/CpxP family protein refolding chaperone